MVKGRGKITRLCDDNMGLDLQFFHNNIARILHGYLNNYFELKMNETCLMIFLRDP